MIGARERSRRSRENFDQKGGRFGQRPNFVVAEGWKKLL